MSASLKLRRASAADLRFILDLLRSNGLCFEDVPKKVTSLFIGYADSKTVGIGGVEVFGEVGLLRSVVIKEDLRGKGVGKALVTGIIERAKAIGVRRLYLLTTTAEDFFRQIGFQKIERNAAPEAIKNTTEFKQLCSVTSVLMLKKIT